VRVNKSNAKLLPNRLIGSMKGQNGYTTRDSGYDGDGCHGHGY
jgi:hypothetical protein